MAKPENVKKNDAIVSDDFDVSQFVPQGLDAKNVRETGLLRPMYRHDWAWDNKFPPVMGYMDRIEQLPIEEFDSLGIVIVVTQPTKAVSGTGANLAIVDVKPGEELLFPINGKIRNDKRMLTAATDRVNYFWAAFRPEGPFKTGRVGGNPMWNYKTKLVEQPIARVGTRFEVRGEANPLLQRTGDGTVYDLRTGEIVESTPAVPAGRALPQAAPAS